jgi:hypothetical protein
MESMGQKFLLTDTQKLMLKKREKNIQSELER